MKIRSKIFKSKEVAEKWFDKNPHYTLLSIHKTKSKTVEAFYD